MRILLLSHVPGLCWKNACNLHRAGHEVHVVTEKRATGLRFFPFVQSYTVFPCDFRAPGASLDAFADTVNALCRRWKIDVIFPVEVDISALTERASPQLHTPTIPLYDATRRQFFADKWNFFTFATAHGLPVPHTQRIAQSGELDAALLRTLHFPLIVKPAFGADGHGVAKIDSVARLLAYAHAADTAYPLLLQAFIPGDDLVAAILRDAEGSLAWAIHHNSGHPPVRYFSAQQDVLALAGRLLEAIDYRGMCVIDLRRDARNGSLQLIEINPRFGGSELHYAKVGVNFSALAVHCALGGALADAFTPARSGASATTFGEKLLAHLSDAWDEIAADFTHRLLWACATPLAALLDRLHGTQRPRHPPESWRHYVNSRRG